MCISVGVAIMCLQNPPVNSLSLDFLTEFCSNVEKLETDKSCRGLIITSVQYNHLADCRYSCVFPCLCDSFADTLHHVCISICCFNPEPAQGVLSRAGHHGDVWEESRALRRVLESCSGDVAEALQLQHGHHRCNQCMYENNVEKSHNTMKHTADHL